MEKINTMGKTITGLTEHEVEMIIRALNVRSLEWKNKEDKLEGFTSKDCLILSKRYSELARFVSEQTK